MTNILIRDLDEQTHRTLARRAGDRGQSLQQYLTAELTRLASAPTLEEVLRRIEGHRGGRVGFDEAVADLAAERGRE